MLPLEVCLLHQLLELREASGLSIVHALLVNVAVIDLPHVSAQRVYGRRCGKVHQVIPVQARRVT